MEPLTPQDPHRIGPYRLLARLGEGGMGTVYLARSDRGRTVAVKTIIGELAQQPDFRARFAAEITAAQRVGGQWTAPVLDADTQATTPWYATGYIAGPSLHQVVDHDHGPLPERSVLLLAGGLVQALKAIHGAGLVHRDLKPSNVLVTIDGPRVIDFGIARAMETMPGEGLTRTGATVGSPGFMSPEQVRGQHLTPASDVFCLGSVLAFAATGRTPFGSLDSGMHILMFRIAEETPDLTGIPDGLYQLIAACLAKEPEQRPGIDQLLSYYPAPSGGAAESDGEPWLPGAVVAQLGREAVSLLDSESPETASIPRVNAPLAGNSQPGTNAQHSPPPPSSQHGSPAYAQPTAPYGAPQTPAPQGAYGYPGPQQQTPPPGPGAPGPGGYGTPVPPPVPSPYAASPSPSPYGGAPGTPAPTPTPGGGRPGRPRNNMMVLVAVVAVMAIIGVVAAVALSGGGGGGDGDKTEGGETTEPVDTTPIGDGYIGAWQGEYGTQGESGWKALWFEIHQGKTGESVGKATVTYLDSMCVYDVRLESFDNQLNFTEVADHSVPEDEVSQNCRADGTVQSLKLADGSLQWTSGDQEATLSSAEGGDAAVPDEFVGEWYDSYSTDEVTNGLDEVSVTEGAIGENVLRWSWTQDDVTCVTENQLAHVGSDRMLLSPDILVTAESDDTCEPLGSVWVTVEADGNLYFQWTNDPAGDNTYVVRGPL
ncbi:serine/threonine-protein kinase [Streptomyces sp. 6N223]|uniref:serine/threonine-protein kinase n=1 Tax=Streptomyces sp. 6N223 TaxID=3457412 RepID=UPI003FD2DA7D